MQGIFLPNKLFNSKLLENTNQETMDNFLKQRRWRWLGHYKLDNVYWIFTKI
jgi:hypothetical protein